MNGQRQGTKEECFAFLEEIKGMGYEIIGYCLSAVDALKPEGDWFISVDFRMKVDGKEINE